MQTVDNCCATSLHGGVDPSVTSPARPNIDTRVSLLPAIRSVMEQNDLLPGVPQIHAALSTEEPAEFSRLLTEITRRLIGTRWWPRDVGSRRFFENTNYLLRLVERADSLFPTYKNFSKLVLLYAGMLSARSSISQTCVTAHLKDLHELLAFTGPSEKISKFIRFIVMVKNERNRHLLWSILAQRPIDPGLVSRQSKDYAKLYEHFRDSLPQLLKDLLVYPRRRRTGSQLRSLGGWPCTRLINDPRESFCVVFVPWPSEADYSSLLPDLELVFHRSASGREFRFVPQQSSGCLIVPWEQAYSIGFCRSDEWITVELQYKGRRFTNVMRCCVMVTPLPIRLFPCVPTPGERLKLVVYPNTFTSFPFVDSGPALLEFSSASRKVVCEFEYAYTELRGTAPPGFEHDNKVSLRLLNACFREAGIDSYTFTYAYQGEPMLLRLPADLIAHHILPRLSVPDLFRLSKASRDTQNVVFSYCRAALERTRIAKPRVWTHWSMIGDGCIACKQRLDYVPGFKCRACRYHFAWCDQCCKKVKPIPTLWKLEPRDVLRMDPPHCMLHWPFMERVTLGKNAP